MEYLKANGVPEEQITMRFHGERYPLVANNSAPNRARNRRVTLQLSREPLPVNAVESPSSEALAALPDGQKKPEASSDLSQP
ncbi:hypothetical protein D9M71_815110 [compost metagenome]